MPGAFGWFSDPILSHTSKVTTTVFVSNDLDSQNAAIRHVKNFESVPPSVQFIGVFLPVECGLWTSGGLTNEADNKFLCNGQISNLQSDLWCNCKIQWEIKDKFLYSSHEFYLVGENDIHAGEGHMLPLRCINTPSVINYFKTHHHHLHCHVLMMEF